MRSVPSFPSAFLLVGSLLMPGSTTVSATLAQESAVPEDVRAATRAAEDRETLELIREAIANKDLEGAREILREAIETLGGPKSGESDRLGFLLELERVAGELGSLQDSKRILERVLQLRERTLSPDHGDIVATRVKLGLVLRTLGDLERARDLLEQALAVRARTLSPGERDLLAAKGNLALVLCDLGDLARARQLQEEVVEAWTKTPPSDKSDLLRAKESLAMTLVAQDDLAAARALVEEVLAARQARLPPDHIDVLMAKGNVASVAGRMGDRARARELEEEVLQGFSRILPADHAWLLFAKQNLAVTRNELGDLRGARELEEQVLAARLASLPPDHVDVLEARSNLATTMTKLGDVAAAQKIFSEVLAAYERLLPSDHPELIAARQNLAVTKKLLGDPAGARELEEGVLAARRGVLPAGHSDLAKALGNLAVTRMELGDLAGARELLASRLHGLRARASELRCEAPRLAREAARLELHRLSEALFLAARLTSDGLDRELFATLECLREVSVASSEAAHALARHPELEPVAREVAQARSQLNDFVSAGRSTAGAAEQWQEKLLRLVSARDEAERRLGARLAEAGASFGRVDAGSLGARLAPGTAAVSYFRYRKEFEKDAGTGKKPAAADWMVGFLVKPGGAIQRIELGPVAEVEDLVQGWRAAVHPSLHARGPGASGAAQQGGDLGAAGQSLRARVLDPFLAAAGEIHTLHVELDDVLFLVPLDALPLGDGLVGERIAIHSEPTFARIVRDPSEVTSGGVLMLAGGIDYDAEPVPDAALRLEAAGPPLEDRVERSGTPAAFPYLIGTMEESAAIAALYGHASDKEPLLLTGASATKSALHAGAPRTRFLHLATHGWFAGEVFRSQLDARAEDPAQASWLRAEETLRGFAPETLCGLALAGANRGRDALGRVPGILTAEELATLDLHRCELAVLSACETNVGIRRAGQGIQSLQTALHAAGARTAITSLWKVEDKATRRLFELFYSKLWKEGLGKAEALWQAKMTLCAEGHPPRDWTGWVLSGDPD